MFGGGARATVLAAPASPPVPLTTPAPCGPAGLLGGYVAGALFLDRGGAKPTIYSDALSAAETPTRKLAVPDPRYTLVQSDLPEYRVTRIHTQPNSRRKVLIEEYV